MLLQSCSCTLFLIKKCSAFLLETQWAGWINSLTSALHKTLHFPVRTFPFILLWQERKEERALLEHMTSLLFLTKKIKNAHSNILSVFSMGKKMHLISITQLTMPRPLSMCGTTEEMYYYQVCSVRKSSGRSRRDSRFPLHFNWICQEYEISWTVCGSVIQLCFLCGKELAVGCLAVNSDA